MTTGVALRYTGQQLDPESGLYYYRARWYSPYMGRFLSTDPIGLGGGTHLYRYVGNDPINFDDPSGLQKQRNPYHTDNPWKVVRETLWGMADGATFGLSEEGRRLFGADAVDESSFGYRFGQVEGALGAVALTGGTLAAERALVSSGRYGVAGRLSELEAAIPAGSRRRVTYGAGIAEDAMGVPRVIIGTSERNGYLRPGVTLNPGEVLATGPAGSHAEIDIMNYANQQGWNLLGVGATRPICPSCAAPIVEGGIVPLTPLKGR